MFANNPTQFQAGCPKALAKPSLTLLAPCEILDALALERVRQLRLTLTVLRGLVMMYGSILHVSRLSSRAGNRWTSSPPGISVDVIERTSITQSKSIGDGLEDY